MDVIVERPAALDVHKEQVTACVRLPGADGKRAQGVREFKTTVGGLLVLHEDSYVKCPPLSDGGARPPIAVKGCR